MSRSASAGFEDLIKRTCGPKVESKVTVDQIYAHYQHESLDLKHPRGGQAKFLELPMIAEAPTMLQSFASELLDAPDAARLWDERLGVHTAELVRKHAPILIGDLKNSAGVVTKVGGTVFATHPPVVHRLTEAELAAKDDLRGHHE